MNLKTTLHIVNGDGAGDSLGESGVPGEILVCRDLLYDGFRNPGWPDNNSLNARALFLEKTTAGGLSKEHILGTLKNQYQKLATVSEYEWIVLWFDACLCDQSMLTHILTCLVHQGVNQVDLICIDAFAGIVPFNGLGQLRPSQLASLIDLRRPVTDAQFKFAKIVDKAFATQDLTLLAELSCRANAPLPWIPAAAKRWLKEQPDPATGLGLLESLILAAIDSGSKTPAEIFESVAAADSSPQYWGDIILWQKINGMADRKPPLVDIEGPVERLPQWESTINITSFKVERLQGG